MQLMLQEQRQHGGHHDNPTVQDFIYGTQSLRIQGSLAKDPIRGNCSRLNTQDKEGDFIDKGPLPKDSSVQNPTVTSLLLAMWKSLGSFRNKC